MPISLLPGSEMKPTLRVPILKLLMIRLIVIFVNGGISELLFLGLRADLPEHRGEVNGGKMPSMIGTILLLDSARFDIELAFLRERPPILATQTSSPSTSSSARWKSG